MTVSSPSSSTILKELASVNDATTGLHVAMHGEVELTSDLTSNIQKEIAIFISREQHTYEEILFVSQLTNTMKAFFVKEADSTNSKDRLCGSEKRPEANNIAFSMCLKQMEELYRLGCLKK